MHNNTSTAYYKPLALLLACALLIVGSVLALAGSVGNLLTDVKLTDFKIKTTAGNDLPAGGTTVSSRVRLDVSWDASAYGYSIQEGQYFDVTLPEQMTFLDTPGNLRFALTQDGAIDAFANVVITPTAGGGGTLRVTFTSYVQDQQWSEVKGTLHFLANFVKSKTELGEENTYTINIAGQYIQSDTIIVKPQNTEAAQNEKFKKWSGVNWSSDRKAGWAVRINAQEKLMKDVVVKDHFPRGDTDSQIFIYPDSFTLQKVLYTHNAEGEIDHGEGFTYSGTPEKIIYPTDTRLKMDSGNAGFTFTLGSTEEALPDHPGRYYTYLLRYVSSYEPGKLVRNQATGSYKDGPPEGQPFYTTYQSFESGGDGTDTNAGYTARKLWVNRPATGQVVPTFLLKQDGVVMSTQPTPTITEYEDFIVFQWTQLPVTNPATSLPHKYSVEEKGVADGMVVLGEHVYRVEQDGGDITNIYRPPGEVYMPVRVKKAYDGPPQTAAPFTFQLLSEDRSTVLQTKTLTTAGYADTMTLRFDAPGTYTFHLKEVQGSAERVSYDQSEYTLTYTITLNTASNTLEAVKPQVLKDGKAYTGDLVFTNTYTPPAPPEPPVKPERPTPTYPTLRVPLSVKKVLKNGALQAGAFTFQLQNGAGEKEYVTNLADGTVAFPDRTFSKVVSNYLYTIREIPGTDDKMVYDDTVYTVKVTTRAVNGQLEATVNVEKNGTPYAGPMVFTNQRKLPPTGDSTYTTLALLLGASLLLMGGAYMVSRKRKGHDAA